MTIEKFAKHITSHGSVYSRADISAILYMAVDCMREMLLEGKKMKMKNDSSPLPHEEAVIFGHQGFFE